MKTVDELMEAWGRKFLGVPDHEHVWFDEDTVHQLSGCETCGDYETGYTMLVYGHTKRREWTGGFLKLIEEIQEMRNDE
jgi:hypothetical protein